MSFILSNHAEQERQRRGISLELVHSILNHPQQIVNEKYGRKAYQSQIDLRGKRFLLRAIVADNVDPAVVITVYLTSQISKYWRT